MILALLQCHLISIGCQGATTIRVSWFGFFWWGDDVLKRQPTCYFILYTHTHVQTPSFTYLHFFKPYVLLKAACLMLKPPFFVPLIPLNLMFNLYEFLYPPGMFPPFPGLRHVPILSCGPQVGDGVGTNLADINFQDAQALNPMLFDETSMEMGRWRQLLFCRYWHILLIGDFHRFYMFFKEELFMHSS